MTWFRVGGAGIPASLKNAMNAVFNKKFGTSGQNYPPNSWPDDVNLLGPLPEKMVAGAIAHTDDAADTVPVKSMICSIVPKQAGSGTPSPTNVRSLSGYTGMNLYKTGQNLLDMTVYDGGVYNPDIGRQLNLSLSSSQFTKTGNAYSIDTTTEWKMFAVRMPVKAGVTYYIKYTMSASGETLGSSEYYLDADNKVINSAWNATNNPYTRTRSSTAPSNSAWFVIVFTNRGTATNTLTITEPQIVIGSSEMTYEAYSGETISDSWSSIGAIYGGERDLTTRVLRVTHSLLNFSDLTWQPQTASGRSFFLASVTGMENTNNTGVLSDMIDYVGNVTVAAMTDPSLAKWLGTLRIYDTSCSDVTALSAKYGNAKILIPLATPIEYTNIQPYDFETLYAVNNFFSDIEGGQTQLTYRQDIALALQAVSSSRGLMMASRPVTQLIGEESDPDQVNELVENDETEQEGEDNAR